MIASDMMVGARLHKKHRNKAGLDVFAVVQKVDGEAVTLKYETTGRTGIASMRTISESYELAKDLPAQPPLLAVSGMSGNSEGVSWQIAPIVGLDYDSRKILTEIAHNTKRIADYLWSKRPGEKVEGAFSGERTDNRG